MSANKYGLAIARIARYEKELQDTVREVVSQYPAILERVPQSEAICLAAVEENGLALRHVKAQNYKIIMAAVRNNGDALEYAAFQTPDICHAAVENNGMALEYVEEQTPELCEMAIRVNPCAIRGVREQTEDLARLAVELDPYAWCLINDKFRELFDRERRLEEDLERWLEEGRSNDPFESDEDPFSIDEPDDEYDPFDSVNEPAMA